MPIALTDNIIIILSRDTILISLVVLSQQELRNKWYCNLTKSGVILWYSIEIYRPTLIVHFETSLSRIFFHILSVSMKLLIRWRQDIRTLWTPELWWESMIWRYKQDGCLLFHYKNTIITLQHCSLASTQAGCRDNYKSQQIWRKCHVSICRCLKYQRFVFWSKSTTNCLEPYPQFRDIKFGIRIGSEWP